MTTDGTALTVLDPLTREHVERAAAALQREFEGIFSQETIARYIAESVDVLGDAPNQRLRPVLAHRFARERLQALAQADQLITKTQSEVLFVCVQNAGRSQIAASLVTLRSRGAVHVRSAGSAPAEGINPLVKQEMTEIGVDLAEAFPKPLTERGRPRRRRRDHHGVRRRLSDLPREALRGLGARRPGRSGVPGRGTSDPRGDRPTRSAARCGAGSRVVANTRLGQSRTRRP